MEKNQQWLRKTKRKTFYTAVACEEFRAGAESLLQVSMVLTYKKISSSSTKHSQCVTLEFCLANTGRLDHFGKQLL